MTEDHPITESWAEAQRRAAGDKGKTGIVCIYQRTGEHGSSLILVQ